MNNWKTKVLSTALALSLVAPIASFAADESTTGDTSAKKGFALHQRNAQSQSKMLELVSKYTPETLSDWQNALTEQEQLLKELREKAPVNGKEQKPELSDETKAKMQAIREAEKNGEITAEEAAEQLKALGIQLKGNHQSGKQLSDEDKTKIQTIRESEKNGEITAEEAQEQLKALGINFGFRNPKNSLSDEDKTKMQAIRESKKNGEITTEEAQEQLKALDINFGFRNPKNPLSDEDKAKMQAIRESEKNGEITAEEAREQLKALGIQIKGNFAPKDNLKAQLAEAVNSNDEAKIQELLPQLLNQLKERNQQLSQKISESNQ